MWRLAFCWVGRLIAGLSLGGRSRQKLGVSRKGVHVGSALLEGKGVPWFSVLGTDGPEGGWRSRLWCCRL